MGTRRRPRPIGGPLLPASQRDGIPLGGPPALKDLPLPTSFVTPYFAPEGQPESSAALQCRGGARGSFVP